MKGCHVAGYNAHSLGVCYEGGHAPLDSKHKFEDNRTTAQRAALREVFSTLHNLFPTARIVGHNELNPKKACPCLSQAAMEEYRRIFSE